MLDLQVESRLWTKLLHTAAVFGTFIVGGDAEFL